MVVMLNHVDGELKFCKMAIDHTPPLVMTEEDGTWMYSVENLLKNLRDRKYTEIGIGKVSVEPTPCQ
jgi:hypothetical protein